MFLNFTLAFGHTSPIIASGILNPALAYLLCSSVLHVGCSLLPEDLITSPNIGARHENSILKVRKEDMAVLYQSSSHSLYNKAL
jgi:hypothetical protein